jgi:hypothetical protein
MAVLQRQPTIADVVLAASAVASTTPLATDKEARAFMTAAIGGENAPSATSARATASRSRAIGESTRVAFGWDMLVPHVVHPTKVIIIEAVNWIDRPVSATELEKLASGTPDLSAFSFHLKTLAELGVVEVVAKLKTRKSQSSQKETFFYFARQQDRWAVPIAHLNDPADFLTQAARSLVEA